MALAVILIILSPTVYVDIIKADQKKTVEAQVKEIDTRLKAVDADMEGLKKQVVAADVVARMNKTQKAAAEKSNTGLLASIDARTRDKDSLAAQKKEASSKMPVAPIKYKNVGLFSMAAAFLVGILVSLLTPEKDSETKFADEKLREYVGIGAE